MKDVAASTMADDLKRLGIDPLKPPPLNKLSPDVLRKVMVTFTKSLGVKCEFCHDQNNFKAPTPHKKVAAGMWQHFVLEMRLDGGGPLYCDSCHSGKAEFLDRHDNKALQGWMEANYVKKLKRADKKEHSCDLCPRRPVRGEIPPSVGDEVEDRQGVGGTVFPTFSRVCIAIKHSFLTRVRVFSRLNTVQGLTQRQQMVLDFIRSSIADRGYPPTLREIGARMGIRSTNGVNDHLRALERKGYLTREDMKSRALRPTTHHDVAQHLGNAANGDGASNDSTHSSQERFGVGGTTFEDVVEIQVLGRVAAGLPLFAEEHVIDTVRVDRGLLKGGREVFGLRVHGDSMIDAGILNGDYIFVRKQLTASRGDIVVALIGDEATVKYYFPEKDYVRFQPANKAMAPILVRAVDFKPTMLLGVVVGVFRRL